MILHLLAPGVGMGGGTTAPVVATLPTWTEDARPTLWLEAGRPTTWTEDARPLTIPSGDTMQAKRRPGEDCVYTIDMSDIAPISTGATISSVGAPTAVPYKTSKTDTTPPTLGSAAVVNSGALSGKAITITVTGGGTDGINYLYRALCTLSDGTTRYGELEEECTFRPLGTV